MRQVGFDIGEELDAAPEHAERHIGADQKGDGDTKYFRRMSEQALQRAEIETRRARDLVEIAIFGGFDGCQQLAVILVGAANDAAENWNEH